MGGVVSLVRNCVDALFAEPGRWPRNLCAVACAVVVAMFCLNHDMNGDPKSPRGDGVYRPVLARGDGHMLYLMARSTALDGDWIFDNDLARFGDPWNEPRTKTGRKSIVHPIGPALVWTPLIWCAEGGAFVANLFGADIPMHGYTLWHQRFVFLTSPLFACFAVLLGRRLALRTFGGPWSASLACIAVLLGTSLTYYATYMPSYSHAMDAFACAGFLAYWAHTRGRVDVKRWVVMGALLGIAALIRVQEVALGIVVLIECVSELVKRRPEPADAVRWLAGGMIALAVAFIVFLPQIYEWHVVFGSVTQLPQGARFTRFNAPMIAEVLFSARNGWFSTTPLAYAGCIGLAMLPRPHRLLGLSLLAAVVVQIYLNSTVLDWWSGASFGQRRMCNVTLPLVVGLACLLWRAARALRRFDRVPYQVWLAAAVVALTPFVAMNLKSVRKLKGGKAASAEVDPTCCSRIWSPLRRPAQWIYDHVGNPFELPASAYFAYKHDVPMSRWDHIVGRYPLQPGLADLHDDARFYAVHGTWKVSQLTDDLVGGWSPPQTAQGRAFRYTTSDTSTVLVPNLMPESERVTVWLASAGAHDVELRWNGDLVKTAHLDATWTPVTFELHPMGLHTNELSLRSVVQFPLRSGWADVRIPTGVAVSDIELQLIAGGG
jgi:hypothetical protein